MKNILQLLLLLMLSIHVVAQETGNDSYTIQRLIIYNDKGEVLLEKNNFGWMTPALRHNSKVSINQGLTDLAAEFGVVISKPKLSGLFMFISDYKPISQFRQHYSTQYHGGSLIVPENRLDAQWVSINLAIQLMSLPETKAPLVIKDMTQQILNYPEIIWGGTFLLSKNNEKITHEILEGYYPIR
ncbi:hypothetical protein [Marinicella sp. W31]|uniref:hypothetical protein n=1 Tax=Marinicella sp. W31 TaxID=3023713 RepID=UPI0037563410